MGLSMKGLKTLTVTALALATSSAFAVPSHWGDDITIFDENTSNTKTWYNGASDSRIDQNGNSTREDREVEPGMQTGQVWDAEGFFQKNNSLTFVAGFNLQDGYGGHTSGDLFIDIDVTGPDAAQYGDMDGPQGNRSVKNRFGYDYVFDIDWATKEYNVYQLNDDSFTITAFEKPNQGSNPWGYDASNNEPLITSGTFDYTVYTSSAAIDDYFHGQYHYEASGFDLSFLGNTDFIAHWTMSCGNDNLMGQGTVDVPEPASIALLSIGLLGLGFARRKAQS